MKQAKVTKAMLGVPDTTCVPIMLHVGDVVEGDLAREAHQGGWGYFIDEDGKPLSRKAVKALLSQPDPEPDAEAPAEEPAPVPAEEPVPEAAPAEGA